MKVAMNFNASHYIDTCTYMYDGRCWYNITFNGMSCSHFSLFFFFFFCHSDCPFINIYIICVLYIHTHTCILKLVILKTIIYMYIYFSFDNHSHHGSVFNQFMFFSQIMFLWNKKSYFPDCPVFPSYFWLVLSWLYGQYL